ncbi:hypothetical protein DSAG12_02610 [Promethearchaeum syntrophicum]|uniref:Uncharacterized protein n=1 Tax=Promethearchaeum syntrophicum TaxID=2594042 RepID=A0A5B9DDC9_9ARCH|nr:hypothetical protein [Candidatus Prometheoarchaeum syntrophicum]QEE16780.1 hypothetical protein DSAG12_02610 [Candidatus Prometheoarchaeum syntrophicum]
MKTNKISYVIGIILLSSMGFSVSINVIADSDTTFNYESTYFNYTVAEGDVFEYDIKYDYNFTASETFYTEIANWMENNSIPYFPENAVDLESLIEDYEKLMQLDITIRLNITDMYHQFINETTSDNGWKTRYNDIFNGSIQVKLNKTAEWDTPEVILLNKLNQSKEIFHKYLNSTQYEIFEEQVDYLINETINGANSPDWKNIVLTQVSSQEKEYYENGTLIEDPIRQLENGTTEPKNPFPEFGYPQGIPLILPTEMNFADYYTYFSDLFDFTLLYNIENEIDISPLNTTSTLQNLIGDGGVPQLYVDEKAIGISLDFIELNTSLLSLGQPDYDEYDSMSEGLIYSSTQSTLLSLLTPSIGKMSFAAEYDENWALNTFAIYSHSGMVVNISTIEGLPNLENEEVLTEYTFTMSQKGARPPTEEDIEEGKIGENSNFFDIPGYSISFIGLFGLISVVSLIVKHRK